MHKSTHAITRPPHTISTEIEVMGREDQIMGHTRTNVHLMGHTRGKPCIWFRGMHNQFSHWRRRLILVQRSRMFVCSPKNQSRPKGMPPEEAARTGWQAGRPAESNVRTYTQGLSASIYLLIRERPWFLYQNQRQMACLVPVWLFAHAVWLPTKRRVLLHVCALHMQRSVLK